MRTTVTLDSDVEALVSKAMRERGLSFKAAVNEALRRGLVGDDVHEPYDVATYAMGRPKANLDRATQLAAELEDEELLRKMHLGK
ncbi:MAG TPA: hypothetical protein VFD59_10360 [Nocardioidaceae bacterium]|nr:hypothetical protein [Nocardioidaceae bacterium]